MSTLLTVDRLSKSYGDNVLFDDISFVINRYQKLALVARNGAGKTSLLNILAGIETADSGSVTFFHGIEPGYLMQEPDLDPLHTVFNEVYSTSGEVLTAITSYEAAIRSGDEDMVAGSMERMDALNGWEYEIRIKQILSQLRIPDLDQPVSRLSGGQRKRVALAKVLITEPDFMILDEPTNHLDVEMVEWLEEYLSERKLTLLMVTHDRYFLDRVCGEILGLDHTGIHRYRGNYFFFLEKQAERIGILGKETARAQNLMRKEQEWIRRMPKARTTKSKARIDSFRELQEIAGRKVPEETMNIQIEAKRMGRKILEVNDIDFSWGNKPILKGFTYTFKRNEKIGIIGNNGTGKSSFLDLLTGRLKPDRGSVRKGETVSFGYFTQAGLPFDPEMKVIDVVSAIADVVKLGTGDTITVSAFLNHFMFPYSSHHQPVSRLSGGEKRRLYLVTVLMSSPNFLILDEPTNDLDIITLNLLEEYLESFKGCVLVVTHDRFFLDKVASHLFIFRGDGVVQDFPGNYSQYRSYKEKAGRGLKKIGRREIDQASLKPAPGSSRQPEGRGLSYREQKELESLEVEISRLEEEQKKTEFVLRSGLLPAGELYERSVYLASVINELEKKR